MAHNEIEWDVIDGMRHVLVHGYYQMSEIQLWRTIQNDIPKMRPYIVKFLKEEK